jgi:hypothetical protein
MELRNFGMMIPKGPILRDDGKPAIYAKHKEEYIKDMIAAGKFDEVSNMTWAERDEHYLEWEKTFKQP